VSVKGLSTIERTWNPCLQLMCVISQQYAIYELEEILKGRKEGRKEEKKVSSTTKPSDPRK
jgi:hypothetical protein